MTTLQRRVIQVGALAVVALACYAEALYSSRTWYSVLVDIVPGSSFVLAGLIAWSLRPRNRVGLLMIGVGVGLLTVDAALQDRVGRVWQPAEVLLVFVSPLWAVVLIHLLLAFPGGRLVSRLDRVVVRSFYSVVPLAAALAGDRCPRFSGRWSRSRFSSWLPLRRSWAVHSRYRRRFSHSSWWPCRSES